VFAATVYAPCLFEGSCHCGAISFELATNLAPSALPVRICGCTFCLKHRPRYTSDPAGHVEIRIAGENAVSRYRFGLKLADFLICRTCGVFVAAHEPDRAVVNIETLARAAELTAEPIRLTIYDTEDAAARLARRAKNWTPAIVRVS
jgi:hypothetical protein